jgi:hypothetical protein
MQRNSMDIVKMTIIDKFMFSINIIYNSYFYYFLNGDLRMHIRLARVTRNVALNTFNITNWLIFFWEIRAYRNIFDI